MIHKKLVSNGAYLSLITVNIYWGLTQVLMKHVLEYMSSAAYVMLRYGTAAIIMLVFLFANNIKPKKATIKKGIILGIMLSIQTALNTYGLYFTSTSNSIFIMQLSIIFIPLYYLIRDQKAPKKHFVIGSILIITGLFIFSNVIGGALNIGDYIALVSTFFACAQIVLAARYLQVEHSLELAIIQIITAGVFSGIMARFDFSGITWNKESIMIIILTGIIGTGVANTMRLYSQRTIDPGVVSLINTIHPVFSMIGAAMIPNVHGIVESITQEKVIGTCVILSGLFYYFLKEMKLSKSASHVN